ncbi:MAG: DNA polymerase IV [Betaproteobacteria bacterium]|nr:DNA polymerase IV [Betaproteobacteria bacterium]
MASYSSLDEPPRRIIHLDMDAFYASVESRDNPELRGKPLAVGGSPESRGVVAAASYEARTFGVRSAMPMARAVRLCPELLIVPPDFTRYREASQKVMAILRAATPLVEPLSLDEAYLDVTENHWGEPLAMNVALRIKQTIKDELQLTASAGVAPNKFLAKIASGWQKPDGLTVIAPERMESFLHKLPAEALWGVGPVTAKKLRAIGVERLVDVRTIDRALLANTVGSLAEWLIELSYGRDPRPVEPNRETKSVSCETTYAKDLTDWRQMNQQMQLLAEDVAEQLKRKGLRARTVTIKVRYGNFKTVTRSHTTEYFTDSRSEIVNRAQTLLERTEAAERPVRLLGVGAHMLKEADVPSP